MRIKATVEWIPVSEERPDADSLVLISTPNDGADTGFTDGELWFWSSGSEAEGVTHWAKLPEVA